MADFVAEVGTQQGFALVAGCFAAGSRPLD
jgi:hypothetical protein